MVACLWGWPVGGGLSLRLACIWGWPEGGGLSLNVSCLWGWPVCGGLSLRVAAKYTGHATRHNTPRHDHTVHVQTGITGHLTTLPWESGTLGNYSLIDIIPHSSLHIFTIMLIAEQTLIRPWRAKLACCFVAAVHSAVGRSSSLFPSHQPSADRQITRRIPPNSSARLLSASEYSCPNTISPALELPA